MRLTRADLMIKLHDTETVVKIDEDPSQWCTAGHKTIEECNCCRLCGSSGKIMTLGSRAFTIPCPECKGLR